MARILESQFIAKYGLNGCQSGLNNGLAFFMIKIDDHLFSLSPYQCFVQRLIEAFKGRTQYFQGLRILVLANSCGLLSKSSHLQQVWGFLLCKFLLVSTSGLIPTINFLDGAVFIAPDVQLFRFEKLDFSPHHIEGL